MKSAIEEKGNLVLLYAPEKNAVKPILNETSRDKYQPLLLIVFSLIDNYLCFNKVVLCFCLSSFALILPTLSKVMF